MNHRNTPTRGMDWRASGKRERIAASDQFGRRPSSTTNDPRSKRDLADSSPEQADHQRLIDERSSGQRDVEEEQRPRGDGVGRRVAEGQSADRHREGDDELIDDQAGGSAADRRQREACGNDWLGDFVAGGKHHSAASASASARAGCTNRLSTMSVTFRLAVTARAMTLINSAA